MFREVAETFKRVFTGTLILGNALYTRALPPYTCFWTPPAIALLAHPVCTQCRPQQALVEGAGRCVPLEQLWILW